MADTQQQVAAADDGGGQRPEGAADMPQLAEGIELIGEYEGSGFKEPPCIARRADGHVIQLSKLLYLVAEQVDGQRTNAEIGERVSAEFGRTVSADNVDHLVRGKLRSLGVLAAEDGSSPSIEATNPLLALKFRTAVVPDRLVRGITALFKPLFHPVLLVPLLLAVAAVDVWFFFVQGIGGAARQVAYEPATMLVVLGMVVLSAAFHECGHATGCRYGGAEPGVMGVGLYLVWPAFYTNVTDSYRLSRGGRLRTDLGGMYFNLIFVLVTYGIYALTRFEPLLLVIGVQHMEIVRHLVPFIRLDGYYVASDLTGVPDLFTRIRPILRRLLPGAEPDERVTELKPWARRVVTGWVLLVVPLLLFNIVLLVIQLPRILATTWDSLLIQADAVRAGAQASDVVTVVFGVLQALLLLLPIAGIALIIWKLVTQIVRSSLRATANAPLLRGGFVTATLGLAAFAAFTLLPNGDYAPFQEGEKLTYFDAVSTVRYIPSGRAALTPEREEELGGAPPLRGQTDADGAAGEGEGGGDAEQDPALPAPTASASASPQASASPSASASASPTASPTARPSSSDPDAPSASPRASGSEATDDSSDSPEPTERPRATARPSEGAGNSTESSQGSSEAEETES